MPNILSNWSSYFFSISGLAFLLLVFMLVTGRTIPPFTHYRDTEPVEYWFIVLCEVFVIVLTAWRAISNP